MFTLEKWNIYVVCQFFHVDILQQLQKYVKRGMAEGVGFEPTPPFYRWTG